MKLVKISKKVITNALTYRLQNRKILELEAKIEDLMEMNKTLAPYSGTHSTSSPSSSSLSSTSLSSPLARTPKKKLDEMKNNDAVVRWRY